jgi:hypothetical protein
MQSLGATNSNPSKQMSYMCDVLAQFKHPLFPKQANDEVELHFKVQTSNNLMHFTNMCSNLTCISLDFE